MISLCSITLGAIPAWARPARPLFALVVLFLVFLPGGCGRRENQERSGLVSFYDWKHNSEMDQGWIDEFKPHKIYVKALDVVYRDGLETIGTNFKHHVSKNIVPVVFLENRVFKNAGVEDICDLIKIEIPPDKYPHLQLDVDWSGSTREAYFRLLSELHADYRDLSVTIRLHQVKYQNITGTPPADHGVLMYYNMSDPLSNKTTNYILDLEVASRYHHNFDKYPLPLDLALPIYSQARVYRHGRLVDLFRPPSQPPTPPFSHEPPGGGHLITEDHYFGGHYLYRGDLVRLDIITKEQLQQAVKQLKPVIQPREIIFFEASNARNFGEEFLRETVSSFE